MIKTWQTSIKQSCNKGEKKEEGKIQMSRKGKFAKENGTEVK
jgi:hypothetical protein